jgi:thiamine pyrophosphate-dependent acetolactate synthase large subunit-like protein
LYLHGDIKLTLAALLACIREIANRQRQLDQPARSRHSFAEHYAEAFRSWLSKARMARSPIGRRIQPSQICHALERVLARTGKRALLTVDVGVTTLWVYRHFVGDHDRVWTSSFGTMGFALPGAIALAEAKPRNGPIIALVGDGGLCVTLAELASAKRLSTTTILVVFNNGKLAAVKYEQEVMGWPEFGSQLHNADFAAYARACGIRGIHVESHDELERALAEAISHPGPSLLDVLCDPHELPVPARLRSVQGAGLAIAVLREARERFLTRRASKTQKSRPIRPRP